MSENNLKDLKKVIQEKRVFAIDDNESQVGEALVKTTIDVPKEQWSIVVTIKSEEVYDTEELSKVLAEIIRERMDTASADCEKLNPQLGLFDDVDDDIEGRPNSTTGASSEEVEEVEYEDVGIKELASGETPLLN